MAYLENTNRIAKNTIFLYVRMLLLMVVTLYTSRIILNVLGVEDYGLYNLIAGVIVLFTFLDTAMSETGVRFFTYALGKKDDALLNKYFITSLNIHIILGLVIIVVAEVVGLYLIYNYLVIPETRMYAALVTFHLTILTTFIRIVKTPYNAIIISNEKMSFYAYGSILESLLKLGVVFILYYISCDKLILYAVLLMIISILILIIFVVYCRHKFKETKYRFFISKNILKEIFTFSVWTSLSSFSNIGTKQGLNVLLNMFYGVTLNAAVGIMNQVSTAIFGFVQNFQSAINPQIIKNYAANNWAYLKQLFFTSSKISYYLLFIVSLPIMLCMDDVLVLWLKIVPEYTSTFCVLSIIALLVNTVGGSIWTAIQASGKIKEYQIAIAILTLLNLPIYFILLYMKFSPEYTMIIPIITNAIIIAFGLYIIHKKIHVTMREYNSNIILPILKTTLIGAIIPILLSVFIHTYVSPLAYVVVVSLVSFASIGSVIYFFGLTREEKSFVDDKIKSFFNKNKIR